MGNDPSNFKTDYANKFQEPGHESYKPLDLNPDLQKNHYSFGDRSLKDPKFYQSMYHEVFNRPLEALKNEKVRDDRADRSSNIVFGTDKSNTYQTENHSQYFRKRAFF